MALLDPIHWEAISTDIRELLRFIGKQRFAERFYLFENADRDFQPQLLIDISWTQVRQFFIDQARSLGQTWFGSLNE